MNEHNNLIFCECVCVCVSNVMCAKLEFTYYTDSGAELNIWFACMHKVSSYSFFLLSNASAALELLLSVVAHKLFMWLPELELFKEDGAAKSSKSLRRTEFQGAELLVLVLSLLARLLLESEVRGQ